MASGWNTTGNPVTYDHNWYNQNRQSNSIIDLQSNGFKIIFSGGNVNTAGNILNYCAFAEMPERFANSGFFQN